jgi:hypothetical protein
MKTSVLMNKKDGQLFQFQFVKKGMVGDTGFEPVTSTVCMIHMILKNSLISHFFYYLFVSSPLFFLCCPIFAHSRLFSPQSSHNFSHNTF